MTLGKLLRTWRVSAGQIYAEFAGAILARGPMGGPVTTLAYSAAPVMNASLSNAFVMTVSDGVAFVIGAPINPPPGVGMRLALTIRNASGGAHGAGTWNAIFKTSGNVPAIANGFSRTFEFQWNGTNWVEVFRTAADVAN